jgi:hypothetical protein
MIKVSCMSLKRFHGNDEAQTRLRLITPSYDRDQFGNLLPIQIT